MFKLATALAALLLLAGCNWGGLDLSWQEGGTEVRLKRAENSETKGLLIEIERYATENQEGTLASVTDENGNPLLIARTTIGIDESNVEVTSVIKAQWEGLTAAEKALIEGAFPGITQLLTGL